MDRANSGNKRRMSQIWATANDTNMTSQKDQPGAAVKPLNDRIARPILPSYEHLSGLARNHCLISHHQDGQQE